MQLENYHCNNVLPEEPQQHGLAPFVDDAIG